MCDRNSATTTVENEPIEPRASEWSSGDSVGRSGSQADLFYVLSHRSRTNEPICPGRIGISEFLRSRVHNQQTDEAGRISTYVARHSSAIDV